MPANGNLKPKAWPVAQQISFQKLERAFGEKRERERERERERRVLFRHCLKERTYSGK